MGFFLEKKSDLRHAVGPGFRVPVVRQAVRNVQSRLQFFRSTRGENVSPPAGPAAGRPPLLGSLARSRFVRHSAAALLSGSPELASSLPSNLGTRAHRALASTRNWQRRAAAAVCSVALSRRRLRWRRPNAGRIAQLAGCEGIS